MNGITISGLYKEIYEIYQGAYFQDDQCIYLTTDRYFEKYVLDTDQGIYEIWAGGCRKKNDMVSAGLEKEQRFACMNGLCITRMKAEPEKQLTLWFSNDTRFEIGLCTEYNSYGH